MSRSTGESTAQSLSRQQFWDQHLQAYPRSGLSRMAYCREHGLVYHQLLYWQKQAASSTADSGVAALDSPNQLIPVTLALRESPVPLTVVLPNGIQIRDIQPGNLSAINQLLEQLRL